MSNRPVATFICEASTPPSKPEIIRGGNGEMAKIRATLQDLNIKNRNSRIYSDDLIVALGADHIRELISRKSWVGEAGHPTDATPARQMTWDPRNLSHRINKWWREGDIIKGEVEALNTEIGRTFHNLIIQELETAFSLRARGNIVQSPKGKLVTAPMHVLCYDWVILPSHKSAYQEEIINNIQESTGNSFISEGFEQVYNISEMIDFAKTSSSNVQYVSEFLESELGSVSLNESCDTLLAQDKNGTKLAITLESNIAKELKNRDTIGSYLEKFL